MDVKSIKDMTDPLQIPNDVKFNAELDFVNLLGDITYVQFLVDGGYVQDTRFVAFLNYLEYWMEPSYSRLLRSEQSLLYLQRLQEPEFVQQLGAKIQLGEWDRTGSITYLEYLKQTALYAQQNQKFIEGQDEAVERGRK